MTENVANQINPVNELVTALAKAHLLIKAPKKDKTNPMFKSKYSSLDAIYEACREPLAKHGLVLSHSVEGNILVTTLRHTSGQFITCSLPMFLDKTTSQGFGSALTYARKYSVCSLLSLPTEEDDDGNAAENEQSSNSMRPDQVQELQRMLGNRKDILDNILKHHKANSLENIPATNFEFIKKNILSATSYVGQ